MLIDKARSLGVDIRQEVSKKMPFGAFGLNFMTGDAIKFEVSTLDL